MADEVWVDILPGMSKFGPQLAKHATKAASSAGSKAGKDYSQSFEQGADGASDAATRELEAATKRAAGLVQKMSGDVSRARQAQQKSAADLIQAELRAADAVEKFGAESKQAEAASLKLDAARGKSEDATRKFEQAENGLREAQKAAKTTTDQLEASQRKLGEEVKQAPSRWGKFGSALGSAKDKVQDFAGGVGGLVTTMAGAVGGAALFSSAFSDAFELEGATGKLEATLGATPAQAEKYGQAASNLYAGAWGDSIDEVGGAVDAVVSSMEGMSTASQSEIEKVTSYTLDLAKAFDVDVAEAASTAGIMMKQGLASDGVDAMDQITWAMQNIPQALRGEVLPVMSEYSGVFAQLGLDGESAMQLVAGGAEMGAIGMDKVGDSLKEFTIRATDLSSGTKDAYKTLGLDANTMTNDLLAGGDKASTAMEKIVSGLQGIKDPGEQAAASIALFGTPLEDLGTGKIPGFLDAINPANAELSDFGGTAEDMSKKLNDNAATSLETLKRSFSKMLSDGVAPALEPLQTVAEWATNTPGVFTAVGIALGVMAVAWAAVTLAASPWLAIGVGIALVIGGIYLAIKNMGPILDWFKGIWDKVWGGIKDAAGGVADWFSTTVAPKFSGVWDTLSGGVEDLRDKFSTAWDNVKTAFAGTRDFFLGVGQSMGDGAARLRDRFAAAWDNVKTAFAALGGFFKSIYTAAIKPIFDAMGAAASWLWNNALKPAFNFIVAAFKGLGNGFKAIYNGLIKPVFTLFGDIVRWLWNEQVRPRLNWIWGLFLTMANKLVGFWRDRIQPMITAFGAGVRALYARFIQPALNTIVSRWNWLVGKIVGFWTGHIRPMVKAFGDFVKITLPAAVRAGLGWVSDRWSWLAGKVRGFWTDRIRPIIKSFSDFVRVTLPAGVRAGLNWVDDKWQWISGKITGVWTDKIRPTLKKFGDFIKKDVPDMVQRGVELIDRSWRKVANFFRKPINWVINTVWNGGIKGAFDNVAKAVKSSARMGRIKNIPAFEKGGTHRGGMALVGEKGPELISTDTKVHVAPAAKTAAILAARGTDAGPVRAMSNLGPANEDGPVGGIGAWAGKAWDAVKGAAGGVISWVRGGLAKAAESLLKKPLGKVAGFVSKYGQMGELGGGVIDWGVDKVLDWIRGKDEVDNSGGHLYDGPMSSGGINRPSRGRITSKYGMRGGRLHGGIDFATGPRGAPTFAAYDGRVHSIKNFPQGSGRSIQLSHGRNTYTHYGHNDGVYVKPGDMVKAGQRIGTEGLSGRTTGAHVHFEKWVGGLWNRVNPNPLFKYDNGGWMPPGAQLNINKTRQPEAVLTNPQWKTAEDAMRLAQNQRDVVASLVGAEIEIGEDGIARFVDGRIEVKFNEKTRTAKRSAKAKAGAR